MRDKKLLQLGAMFAASFGLYLLLARRYPLGASLETPRASWTSMVGVTVWNAALHLAIYLGLTLLFFGYLRILAPSSEGREMPPRRGIHLTLIAWLACSGALMAAAPGGESHDIFDYLFRGRMMTEYGANPLVDTPNLYRKAPYFRFISWHKHVDTYGPVWESTSAAVAVGVRQAADWLGWRDAHQLDCPSSPKSCRLLIAYLTGYRLLALTLTGLSGWLIAAIVGQHRAPLVPLALAAWLLNPLTLIATALGAHNDAVMLVLVLLSWWLLQRERPYLSLLALILAAHVKLTALIWLPVCALWIVRRWGWSSALRLGLQSAAAGVALSWLLYLPFGGWDSLPRMLGERSAFIANSFWNILDYFMISWWGWPARAARRLIAGLSSTLFATGALTLTFWIFNFRPKRWRSRVDGADPVEVQLWNALMVVGVLYLLVGSFWFQHWYVLWVLAPAVLLPEGRFARSLLPWLSFGALASNVGMDFLVNSSAEWPMLMVRIARVTLIWGPTFLAALVLTAGRSRRSKHAGDGRSTEPVAS